MNPEVRCENKRCPTYSPIAGHGVAVDAGQRVVPDNPSYYKTRAKAIERWNRNL